MRNPIAFWLYTCAAAVFMMALIGAITRLTESGLSIVEWKPITGALPPRTPEEWQAAFDLYKKSPQYLKVNHGMILPEFKNIYFWEWLHRLWGRLIGVIYAVPFVWFLICRRLPNRSLPSFLVILALGLAQGGMGWYMVKSGLVDQPAVSHFRLAAHLMLAFLIYACLFRLALAFSVRPHKEAGKLHMLHVPITNTIVLVIFTMIWGAFVAGLRAGLIYNTFPTMDGHWLPPELFQTQPMWKAFFTEPATVQFTHRVLAILTFVKIMLLCRKASPLHPPGHTAPLFRALFIMAIIQVGLGIGTLLTGVNIYLAAAHQAGALVVLTLLLWLSHEIPCIPYSKGKK